jgi:hypothetical protein
MLNVTNSDVELFRTAPCMDELDNSYVLARTDDGQGGSAVKRATGAAGENIVGIAHVSPIASTKRSVVGEQGVALDGVLTLEYGQAVVATSVGIKNLTTGVIYDKADFTTVKGEVTFTDAKKPANTDKLESSYLRSVTVAELGQEGLPLDFANRFQGVGQHTEFATGNSTVHTDFFDTSVPFAVGEPVYVTAEGIPTAKAGTKQIGVVDRAPTAAYPVLAVAGQWKF